MRTMRRREKKLPDSIHITPETAKILIRRLQVEMIAKEEDPTINPDDAVQLLLEHYYGKPMEQLLREYQEKRSSES